MALSSQTATNILLIEDRLSDAELVRGYLGDGDHESFHIFHAPDMASAMPMLAEQNLHAVMLDLFLPDTNELEGLASIQSMLPNVPVLILTGRDDEDLASTAVEHGAQDYLLKDKMNSKMLQRSIRHAIRRKYFQSGIIQQAHFDALTGLPNRVLFRQRLEAALAHQRRSRQKLALMMLDLDGFKSVNDTFGHDAGDILLKEIGHRISECLRPYDVAGRLGGDEFVVLIEDVVRQDDCRAVARKLIDAIERLVVIGDWRLSVGASVGITFCSDADSVTSEALMRQADQAMYTAKKNKKSDYCFYSNAAEPARPERIYSAAASG